MNHRCKHLFYITISGLLSLILQSCSPKIHTSITRPYPSRSHGGELLVFQPDDTIPDGTDALGTVAVKSNGFTTNCDYETVLRLCKKEVFKAGGNGLHITKHNIPSVSNPCHQIYGTILLIPETALEAIPPQPLGPKAEAVGSKQPASIDFPALPESEQALQPDETSVAESPTPDVTPDNAGDTPAIDTEVANSRSNADLKALPDKKSDLADNALFVRVGYASIYSDLTAPGNLANGLDHGTEVTAGYNWIGNKGMGFSLIYSGYMASADFLHIRYKIRMHYFGGEFALRQRVKNWIFRESLGLGYVHYVEKAAGESGGTGGIGSHLMVGIEYRLASFVSLGAHLKMQSNRLSSPTRGDGIGYFAAGGGLSFYF